MDALTDLARRAVDGDRWALDELVRRTQADVWRLCAQLVDAASADDLTQDAYVRIVRALPSFRGESSVRTFILAITRNTCMDELRRRTRRRRVMLRVVDEYRTGVSLSDPTDASDLGALVELLTPERREAFVCTQLLGLGYAETAEICDCPIGTIRSRVARAREDLLAMITAIEQRPEASNG